MVASLKNGRPLEARRADVQATQIFEIVWTKVDEAPALAYCSLLPNRPSLFVGAAGVKMKLKDISL